jgi:hypothetical protein
MKVLFILIFLIFTSCRPGIQENSNSLLPTVEIDSIDSINMTIYKSIKYDTSRILGGETIFEKKIKGSKINRLLENLIEKFLYNLSNKTFSGYNELEEKLNWKNKYNIIQIDKSAVKKGKKEIIEVYLYIYFKGKSYERVDLNLTEYGIYYSFCCTDYTKFPYNTFKGLDEYSLEYCFDLEMKESFIELVNELLIEMKETENPLILESI